MSARILLATCAALPHGEDWGAVSLVDALARRGLDVSWERWDDPAVDWASGLVAVRATWDYDTRLAEFLAWARTLPWLLNSAAAFEWNTDKAYLIALADAGVPVVPTVSVEDELELPSAIAEMSGASPSAVVKPRVGAGGRGVVVFDGSEGGPPGLDESTLEPGPWVVQPLVESVRTEGEYSVFVLDDQPVSMVRKLPSAEEIRVHEEYGGQTQPIELTPEGADLARRAVRAAEELLGERLDYARVDALRLADGTLALSELEVTEPGLYLDQLPENADRFADLVLARLRAR